MVRVSRDQMGPHRLKPMLQDHKLIVLPAPQAYDSRVNRQSRIILRDLHSGSRRTLAVKSSPPKCEAFYDQVHDGKINRFHCDASTDGERVRFCPSAGDGAASDHRTGLAWRTEKSLALADVFGRLHGAAAQSIEAAHAAECRRSSPAMDFPNRIDWHSRARPGKYAARCGWHFVRDRQLR